MVHFFFAGVNFLCRGVLLVWIKGWQGPTGLAVHAGGDSIDFLSRLSFLSSFRDGPI